MLKAIGLSVETHTEQWGLFNFPQLLIYKFATKTTVTSSSGSLAIMSCEKVVTHRFSDPFTQLKLAFSRPPAFPPLLLKREFASWNQPKNKNSPLFFLISYHHTCLWLSTAFLGLSTLYLPGLRISGPGEVKVADTSQREDKFPSGRRAFPTEQRREGPWKARAAIGGP